MTSTELRICLREQKGYYPGDRITGEVQLDLKKPIDVQHISLNFSGYIELFGDKIVLINETLLFAEPQSNQKYQTLQPEQLYKFEFLFTIPRDIHLPSTVVLTRHGIIHYSLTATHKKPTFKWSHTIQPVTLSIKFFDMINVLSPQYTNPVRVPRDIGYVTGNKPTQWDLNITKTAFLPGEVIEVDCNIVNFPDMNKGDAITVSLVRQIQKTNSTKILEEQALSTEYIHLYIDRGHSSTQTISVQLNIPNNAIPTIFPHTGRLASLSYVILTTIDLKGVNSAIKINPKYEQRIPVVIGTYPLVQPVASTSTSTTATTDTSSGNIRPPLMRPAEFYTLNNSSTVSSRKSSVTTIASSTSTISNNTKSTPSHLSHVKPLSKLDGFTERKSTRSYVFQKPFDNTSQKPTRSYLPPHTYESPSRRSYLKPNEPRENTPLKPFNPNQQEHSRSYLSPKPNDNTEKRHSPQPSPRIKPNKARENDISTSSRFHSSAPTKKATTLSALSSKKSPPASAPTYQQQFDDYLPPEITKYDGPEDNSSSPVDKSMEPLPSLKQLSIRENHSARRNARQYQEDRSYDTPEREIQIARDDDPEEFIMRNTALSQSEKTEGTYYGDYDESTLPGLVRHDTISTSSSNTTSIPGLVRHDTISTSSSNAMSEDFNYDNNPMVLRPVRYQ